MQAGNASAAIRTAIRAADRVALPVVYQSELPSAIRRSDSPEAHTRMPRRRCSGGTLFKKKPLAPDFIAR